MDAAAAAEEVYKVLQEIPEGADDAMLGARLPTLPPEALMGAINHLAQNHRISFLQTSAGLIFKSIEAQEASRHKGLSRDDILVLQQITDADNKGIWTKDLKFKTNLQQLQIAKILKTLEQRSLVKSVKSVSNANRKMYMLFELEPAKELTGGAWYAQQTFDREFFETLQQVVYKFILEEGEASLDDISDFIKEKNISNEVLDDAELSTMVNTLYYEDKIEVIDGEDGEVYRPVMIAIPGTSPLTSVPCGVCPVIKDCTPDGPISPATCIYFDKWLDF